MSKKESIGKEKT